MKRWMILFLLLTGVPLFAQETGEAEQQIETVIQAGHYAAVTCGCISPDGRILFTGSEDKTIKAWELTGGREIRSYVDSAGTVERLAVSPDGKLLASVGSDYKLKLWEVETSRLIRVIEIPDDRIISLDFSPDGKYLVAGTGKNHAIAWDLTTYQEHLQYVPVHQDIYMQKDFDYPMARTVEYSADGKYLLTGSNDRTAILFDARSGKEIRKIKTDNSSCTTCAISAHFSPDAQIIAIGNMDTVSIWDSRNGSYLRTMASDRQSYEEPLFSPDGKYLAAFSYGKGKVWDPSTGKLLYETEGHFDNINYMIFSPDSKYLVTGSEDRTSILRNIRTGKPVMTYRGYLNDVDDKILRDGYMYWVALVNEIKISPDGKYLAVGKTGNLARLMEFSTGRVVRTFRGHEGMVVSLDFSPDGKRLATGSVDGTVRIWDIESGEQEFMFPDYTSNIAIFSVDFSPDGKMVATGGWDGRTRIWDLENGKLFRSINSHDGVSSFAVKFSHTGLYVISGGLERKLKMFELDTGKEIREFIGHSDVVPCTYMLPDGRYMITGSWDGLAKMWDMNSGLQVKRFAGHQGRIYDVTVDPQGKYLVTGSDDNTARLWDLHTGETIRIFRGHRGAVSSVHISHDGRFLITGSRDGTIKTWNLETGEELLTEIFLGESDWLVKSPEGFFDASEGAKRSVFFVKGTHVYQVDQFFEDFYRPGLLQEVYENMGVVKNDLNLLNRLNDSPPPIVEILSPEAGSTPVDNRASLLVKVKNTGGGVDELKVVQNGKALPVENQDVRRLKRADQSLTKIIDVDLVPGENRFRISAFSEGRIESSPVELLLNYEGISRTANCYLVVIGIDKYRNPSLDLNYARADASAFSQLIHARSGKLFNRILTFELYDEEATRENILSQLDQLATNARPEDVLFFYYAGHGSMMDNKFYFIPSESVSLYQQEKLEGESIDAWQMQEKLKNIRALKQLVILDACQSGGSTRILAQRGALEEKALAQMARSSGVHVLAASGSEQFASEFSELGHGLFTFVLLEALEGDADGAPKDGKVTVYELKSFLDDQVPEISRKFRGQPQYPYTFSVGQDFPVVIK